MASRKRPMVNVYEDDELVYREMNDDEYAQWKAARAAAKNAPPPEHPLIAQVKAMTDDERATLASHLGIGGK